VRPKAARAARALAAGCGAGRAFEDPQNEEHTAMMDDARLFRRADPDFPITRAVQQRLVAAGRVEGD